MSVRGSNENDYLMRSSGENDYLMSGRLVSEACRTTVNIGLSILDTEKPFVKAINYTLLVTFVAFTQVLVLIRQMEMTSTQAGANRVSLLTVGLQTISDSYLCLAHLTIGIALQTLFNAFATAAFFKFIIFSIFEMRYMLMIWKARRMSVRNQVTHILRFFFFKVLGTLLGSQSGYSRTVSPDWIIRFDVLPYPHVHRRFPEDGILCGESCPFSILVSTGRFS